MSFKKILIANRGEIACRIIDTCQRVGIETVAIYSPLDKGGLFVEQASEAYPLSSNELSHSYLDSQKIIEIALKAECQAIHPGYGFLSENAEFTTLCEKNNITFIGPSTTSIELMGCKKQAKKLMQDNGIPVVPGFNVESDDEKILLEKANDLGYPVLIKAASGGGGKGMKRVDSKKDLISAIHSARRESLKSFASDQLLIEKYLPDPRHIEVQIFSDNHHNTVHLFDRDCSIQRRHQKIIEEAPAINIKNAVREAMYKTAINAAKTINYSGAGTIEFLLDGDDFYFMEMNTRLQVEHPVTELVTGIDLVEWQLLVAQNNPLPMTQEQILCQGHAIEVRLYAEDPDNNFLPQTGTLSHCDWPSSSPHLRIDTGVKQGDPISVYYDPMIAKMIGFGNNRQTARQHLLNDLEKTRLIGPKTNLSFLKNCLRQTAFINGELTTHYLEKNPLKKITSIETAALYAAIYRQLKNNGSSQSPWLQRDHWQANLTPPIHFELGHKDQIITSILTEKSPHQFESNLSAIPRCTAYLNNRDQLIIEHQNLRETVNIINEGLMTHVLLKTAQYTFTPPQKSYDNANQQEGSLSAPMPGMIVSIHCKANERVAKHQLLMVIEAMKMEHPIKAPYTGIVEHVLFTQGAQVNESEPLLALVPLEES